MRYLALFLSVLFLAGCVGPLKEHPVCSGNTLRACQPVLYFDFASAELKPEAKENLDWVYEKMMRFPRKNVKAKGYSDFVGTPEKNLELSKERVEAVRDYLVAKGIDPNRIVTLFVGESQIACHQDSCRHFDRRVELTVFTEGSLNWQSMHLDD